MKTIYISGPMEGYDNNNTEEFAKTEKFLLNMGYDVINPVNIEVDESFIAGQTPTRQDFYRKDIRALTYCDEIFMMKGWQVSHGAQLERQVAFEIGLKIRYHDEVMLTWDKEPYIVER